MDAEVVGTGSINHVIQCLAQARKAKQPNSKQQAARSKEQARHAVPDNQSICSSVDNARS